MPRVYKADFHHDCEICGKEYMAKTKASYCCLECRLNGSYYRHWYKSAKSRGLIREKSRRYARSEAGRANAALSKERRAARGVVYWYTMPMDGLPPELQAFRRLLTRSRRIIASGRVANAVIVALSNDVVTKYKSLTKVREFTQEDLNMVGEFSNAINLAMMQEEGVA